MSGKHALCKDAVVNIAIAGALQSCNTEEIAAQTEYT